MQGYLEMGFREVGRRARNLSRFSFTEFTSQLAAEGELGSPTPTGRMDVRHSSSLNKFHREATESPRKPGIGQVGISFARAACPPRYSET